MSYIRKNLLTNEELAFETYRHWIIFVSPIFWFIISLGLYLATLFKLPEPFSILPRLPMIILPFITLAIAIILMMNTTIDFFMTELAVTNKRVIIKVGFIYRDSIEIMLENVASIEVRQTILGRILNYGSLFISSTGITMTPCNRINDPLNFRLAVQQELDEQRNTAN